MAGNYRLGGLLVLFAALGDGVDGALARLSGTATPLGAFYDSVADRVEEIAILGAILVIAIRPFQELMVVLVFLSLTGSLMISYVKARAEGAGIPCTLGILSKFERTVITVTALFLGHPFWALWPLAILGWLTVAQRIILVQRASR